MSPAPIRIAYAQPDIRVGIIGTNTLIRELGAPRPARAPLIGR
jgi:hypothetical protein